MTYMIRMSDIHLLGHNIAESNIVRYSATRGLLFSHVGWIFFKAKYERMDLIDRQDLERDPGECPTIHRVWPKAKP